MAVVGVIRIDMLGIWEFPKIRGTILGVPILRIIVFWGPPILGNYHIGMMEKKMDTTMVYWG